MNVLVKDMEMPKSCYECPMAIEMDMQGDWYECNFLKKHFYSFDVTADEEEYHRPKGCPLVEVPSAEPKKGKWIPVSERLPKELINPVTSDFYEYRGKKMKFEIGKVCVVCGKEYSIEDGRKNPYFCPACDEERRKRITKKLESLVR